jgi:uncharacterized protein YdhG (YjbR/CyaY superfamily)
VREFATELAPYEISKGTIRFPLAEPVPTKLIERILRARKQEIAANAKAVAPAKKRTKPRKNKA